MGVRVIRSHHFEETPLHRKVAASSTASPLPSAGAGRSPKLCIGEVEGMDARLFTGYGGVLRERLDCHGSRLRGGAVTRPSPPSTGRGQPGGGRRTATAGFDFGGIRDTAVWMLQNERSDRPRLLVPRRSRLNP